MKLWWETILKLKNISLVIMMFGFLNASQVSATLLSNDAGSVVFPGDSLFPHIEYEEKLSLEEITQELESETKETNPKIGYEILERKTTPGGARTDGFSGSSTVVSTEASFTYRHQLPPGVNPDVPIVVGSPYFNKYNFTTDLIEFEIDIHGYRPTGSSSTYDVMILDDSLVALASLGSIGFKPDDTFDFDFEQMIWSLGGTGISSEIYSALSLGTLDIRIFRTSESGDLYLTSSTLELEQVPEPASLILLGSGLLAVGAWGWRRRTHS